MLTQACNSAKDGDFVGMGRPAGLPGPLADGGTMGVKYACQADQSDIGAPPEAPAPPTETTSSTTTASNVKRWYGRRRIGFLPAKKRLIQKTDSDDSIIESVMQRVKGQFDKNRTCSPVNPAKAGMTGEQVPKIIKCTSALC